MIPWQSLGNTLSGFIIEKKAFPGWGKHVNLTFLDINKHPILDEDGKARKVAIYWITDLDMNFPTVDNNFFVPQHYFQENIHAYFDERLYKKNCPKDENGHPLANDGYPIVVHNRTQKMYYDYPGYQAIPLTCIDYYNPRVFEIFASTHITEPCKTIGNFDLIPDAVMLKKKTGIFGIKYFLVKVRPEIIEATKGKKPSDVFDACRHLLGIKEVEINE